MERDTLKQSFWKKELDNHDIMKAAKLGEQRVNYLTNLREWTT